MIDNLLLKFVIYGNVHFLCLVSLLEGSLSGVEALRHLRLDLQARKKVHAKLQQCILVKVHKPDSC